MTKDLRQFTPEELHSISERAFALAKTSDDPSRRAALNLFGEAAENLAVKLPRAAAAPARAGGSA